MRKVFLTLSVFYLFGSLAAQPEEPAGKELFHYVFPVFTEGTVKMKSGEMHKATLNYNTITEEMIFDQAGQKMALDQIETIDTVYIENKKFVPAGEVFYEMATNTPVALFIQHKSDVIPPGSNTGFGTSQTSAITNISTIKNSGSLYQLKLPDDFQLVSKTIYWLKKNNNYYVIKNTKDVQDRFPEKAGAIKDFAKANKISFKNEDDVVKLIRFSN